MGIFGIKFLIDVFLQFMQNYSYGNECLKLKNA